MRYWLFFLFAFFMARNGYGQGIGTAIINAGGNTYSQNNVTYEWSIGELALVETMANNRAIITNGLLQPVVSGLLNTNEFLIFPVNILTPNGDGNNDVWVIKDIEKFPDNELTIFDRAGRTVYHATNYQNDWMGYISGKPLAEGTYYYVIKLKKNSKSGIVKGFITILN